MVVVLTVHMAQMAGHISAELLRLKVRVWVAWVPMNRTHQTGNSNASQLGRIKGLCVAVVLRLRRMPKRVKQNPERMAAKRGKELTIWEVSGI